MRQATTTTTTTNNIGFWMCGSPAWPKQVTSPSAWTFRISCVCVCRCSKQVLSLLNACKVDYEVVNVFDEVYNPGLREAIKSFSEWPTIPQLYVRGEFVGGADILVEMHDKGELQELLSRA
mmetsp:Transcript_27169/g.76643  ORF Transcript_27169/g.76643 Transcript_27169/m.76643 type:complete len:121 (+) Transcript_27169:442-804(+)